MARKVKLAAATPDQLRGYAERVLNIPVDPRDSAQALRAKIGQVVDVDEIEIEDKAEPKARAAASAEDHPSHVTVIIPATKDDDTPVQVGVNGRLMLIKRGEPSRISWPYYVALQNAVERHYRQVTHSDGRIETLHVDVPAIQFSVIQDRAA